MRGDDAICGSLFSYIDLEKRIRGDHPLRVIRAIANPALTSLSGEFQKLYSPLGRESIPPERLLRALLLQAFYSIRSERQLVERIDHDLLSRWFVGLGIEDPVWDATTFTKNRDRLLEGDVAAQFLVAVLSQDQVKALLSSEHFSVDGTLLEAWASLKSFRPKDGSGEPADPGSTGRAAFSIRYTPTSTRSAPMRSISKPGISRRSIGNPAAARTRCTCRSTRPAAGSSPQLHRRLGRCSADREGRNLGAARRSGDPDGRTGPGWETADKLASARRRI
jgi:transposase